MPRATVQVERIRARKAGEMLGIPAHVLRTLVENGDVPGAAKLGGSWTFGIKELTAYKPILDELRSRPKEPKIEPESRDTVYVIRCGYRVKIGFTKHLAKRLYSLQTANHREIQLLKSFDGTISVEKQLHARFADLHVRGEWFKLQKPIKEWLRDEHGVRGL